MTMVSNKKFVTCVEEDIINNLPEHLVDLILERVPLEDGVRTSILSKNWRYRWTTMKALVFDEHLTKKLAKDGAYGRNGFIRIITHILKLHKGPILKFLLHIPKMYLDSFQEVDEWMLLLSRKGVKEIALTNLNHGCEIPLHVFSCQELTKLNLSSCFFKPPLEFKGYLNLVEFDCEHTDIGPNICGTQVNLPQLKKLSFHVCKNICNFNIKVPKLASLSVTHCPDAMLFILLLDSPCLITLMMCCHALWKLVEDLERVRTMNMPTMLCNFPGITTLVMDGHMLKIPKGPAQGVESLKRLGLHYFVPIDLDQFHGVLCLLRNSPNLEWLHLEMKQQVYILDVGPASDDLQGPTCNRLKNVKIGCLKGSPQEMLLMRLLLAGSPSLEKLIIAPSGSSDAQKIHNFAKDVMQFPRASPKAEIIFLDPEPHPKEQYHYFPFP